MVVLDEYKMQLGTLNETLQLAHKQMNVDALKKECAELEEQMGAVDFWNDVDNANKVSARVKSIKSKLDRLNKLDSQSADVETLIEMAEEEDDESLIEELKNELKDFDEKVGALRLEMLLKGPYDNSNAVLSLHAGAGGTEAQDWTEMLYRMYTRYCERKGWKVTELDLLDGDDAGIKSVTFEVIPATSRSNRRTSASTPTVPAAQAVRTLTRSAPRSASRTLRRASSCSARTSEASCRTRKWQCACCAVNCSNCRSASGKSRWRRSRAR